MKKIILIVFIIVCALSLNAQQQGKIRVGLNAGVGLPNAGLGLNGDIDIRYNIMDNFNAGVQLGLGGFIKDVVNEDLQSATICAMTSALINGDYYFNKGTSRFAPFLGIGFGSFSIGNVQVLSTSTEQNPSSFSIESKLGGLLRGGFEAGHFRLSLEYNIIPNSSLTDLTNHIVGRTQNSFLNLKIGFYLGGGHWRK